MNRILGLSVFALVFIVFAGLWALSGADQDETDIDNCSQGWCFKTLSSNNPKLYAFKPNSASSKWCSVTGVHATRHHMFGEVKEARVWLIWTVSDGSAGNAVKKLFRQWTDTMQIHQPFFNPLGWDSTEIDYALLRYDSAQNFPRSPTLTIVPPDGDPIIVGVIDLSDPGHIGS